MLLGRGGDELAAVHDGVGAIRDLASKVRREVRDRERTFELDDLLEAKAEPEKAREEAQRAAEKKKADAEKSAEKKADEPKPDEPKKHVAEAKPSLPVPVVPVPVDPKKRDKRIAVDQHVKPSAEDNPNANFVADGSELFGTSTGPSTSTSDSALVVFRSVIF